MRAPGRELKAFARDSEVCHDWQLWVVCRNGGLVATRSEGGAEGSIKCSYVNVHVDMDDLPSVRRREHRWETCNPKIS